MILIGLNTEQLTPLFISGFLLLFSLIIFNWWSEKIGIYTLVFSVVGVGVFMALLDPFLWVWDEQYHALVAKNMIQTPFKPMLYANPVFDTNYRYWTATQVWLHKQPLFLWQMALSIKLLGTTAFAVRFPSVLLHAAVSFFIYRIGSISVSKRSGFFGAMLFGFAYFPLELVSGWYSTDHNDVAFLFYLFGSFWAWFEYSNSKRKFWLIVIGLFSGGAVLVKWLMGGLIFILWGISKTISEPKSLFKPKSYIPIVLSGLVSLCVFVPWQLYILNVFPTEALHELKLNGKHFFEVVENHSGDWTFHFIDGLKAIYGAGDLIPVLVVLGIVVLIKRVNKFESKVFVITAIIFVYLFFTLAATKMLAFTIIVSPFVYLGIGSLIDSVMNWVMQKSNFRWLSGSLEMILPLVSAYICLNLSKISDNHSFEKPFENRGRVESMKQLEVIEKVDEHIRDSKSVIFNADVSYNGSIAFTFFTGYTAYDFIPTEEQISQAMQKGWNIVIIDDGSLPKYIFQKEYIRRIRM